MARSEARGTRIPLPRDNWWSKEARAAAISRAEKLGIRTPGIRSLLLELESMDAPTDEVTLGRALSGERVTWEVAIPLSSILGLTPPAAVAKTVQQARVFEAADELAPLLEKLRGLKRKI